MAVTYGFYDSLNHDRLYNAQQMSAIFDGIINDGVFMSVGNQFHTVAGTGMQVIVKSGRAWFDSTWTLNDAEYPLSIDAADVLLTRIDAVVLEVNSEVATRANTIKVVKGTPASTPAKPTLTNTATVHQHALAYVTVAKNITAITNSMIEIVVGKTETPYVTAILQTTDITDLFNQWEDYFQKWFDTVRGTLDGDVALNLQNQITSLDLKLLLPSTPPKIGLSSGATGDDMFNVLCKVGDLYVWEKTQHITDAVDAYITYDTPLTNIETVYLGRGEPSVAYFVFSRTAPTIYDNGVLSLQSSLDRYFYIYSSTGSYAEDGTFENSTSSSSSVSLSKSELPGGYIYFWADSSSWISPSVEKNTWYYIPSDAVVTIENPGSWDAGTNRVKFSKLQKVIGHPYQPAGISVTYPVSTNRNAYQEGSNSKPAGTTIKYLGKLGHKARVQVLSYVGTGTYGRSNPNSLTFDFAPKVVIVNGHRVTASYTNTYSIILSPQSGDGVSMLGTDKGYVYWVICEATDRTVSWYAANYEKQLNESGMKYVAVAIG